MRRSSLLFPLILGLLILLTLPACAGVSTVTVTGWGALDGSDLAEARARAITDALGRAVQRSGRTVVASETRLVNDWDLSSQVATESLGVVRGYKILEEGVESGRGYRVRILAQVAGSDSPNTSGEVRVLVVAREQYRGKHTPPQLLGGEMARQLREKGFVVVPVEWRLPLVTVGKGEPRVSPERVRELGEKHQVDYILAVWAEARHSDTANPNLHSARALGKLHLYAAASGELVGSKAAAEMLGWGPSPERAGEAALKEVRGPLALQGVVLVVGATTRP